MQDLAPPASRTERLTVIAVFIYQVLAVLTFLIMPFLAVGYFNTPFLGSFFDNTLISNGVGPTPARENWDLRRQGIEFGDQILRLDGQPVRNSQEIQSILRSHFAGETVAARVKLLEGAEKRFQVRLSVFSAGDRLTYFYVPYFVGLIYLLISWWIFGLRRSETAGRAFTIFATSAAIGAGLLLDVWATHRFIYLWSLAIPLIGAGLVHLALVFPEEARIVLRYPRVRNIVYIPAFILAAAAAVFAYNIGRPYAIATIWRYDYILVGIAVLFFLATMLYRRFRSASPIVRQQSTTILIGTLISFGPITLWFLSNIAGDQNFNPYVLLFVAAFPAFTAYAVMRYRMLRTDYLFSRGIVYALLVVISVAGFVLVSLGLGLIFGGMLSPNNPVLIGLTIVVLVLLLEPLRTRIQQVVDSIFFRGQRAYQERIQTFSRQLTSTVELPSVLSALSEQVTTTMMPDRVFIYLYDSATEQYAAADENGRPASDIRFGGQSPVAQHLAQEQLPLYLDLTHLPAAFEAERTRLSLLGAALFVALPGKDRLSGWLAVGNRRSGETYSSADLGFLESICSQAALAIERAQIITNMERRVHEMNVLSRVAQGVNITLTFDDILELIYAQASQVIPGSDFRLVLHNRAADYFYYAFYLENDERLANRENKPLPARSDLEQDVVNLRRGILTQDYLRECQILGVSATTQGLYAWMGVPMNAGAETIGALSIASRDPSVLYTSAQMDLLQSIADQAASAIVKARLLQETERRAFQLSTINDISRKLTSTLELEPLLHNILESAVSIINCEAGSLFLRDEQTDELVFSVTVGPVASNLVGQRLPPGSGVVGRAVATRAPVLINEAQASPQWNASPDRQTGFTTRAILAAPMEVKDRVIGVIEIINKKDGLPFGADDQEVLTAFGGQAAVAIENARLYTLTDKELTARVEELSVMQRIDRELNASLEIERALRITLEWAMRQSSAEAGLIGILEEGGVRLMAERGFGGALSAYEQDYIPLDHPALREPLASGQAQRSVFDVDGGPAARFLKGARTQLVIPIRREARVIGVFVLESAAPDRFAEQAQSFLSRLSDHAAIAISNAQLYAEVQSANNAKSEFVSFVAHELKNPMTSIKGYTELLAAGAVGPINEMQGNFLTTIKSNVERMSTLVSDLNDNSKIEAGKLRLEFRAVNVPDVVDEVIRSTKRQVDEKKQIVHVNLPSDLPRVWADPTRTAQVLTNLVSNAHKYTPSGGEIVIGAEPSTNAWDPGGASEVVHVWVKDNGIGISPEDQAKIFQKFFRSEDSKAREAPGTGLGLNITRSLTEMQGGKIWFESEFRNGTTFHITIPVSEG
jgi:signal transduction histidine kinase